MIEGIDKELQETLKVFQAKLFGLLLTDNNSAENFRKVRALAIGDIKKATQEHYLGKVPKKTFDYQKEGDSWCKQVAEDIRNETISEMERKIRGDVK